MTDSALVLLAYAAKHPRESRSLREISEITGIPYRTVGHLLTDHRDVLDSTAYAYGYFYRIQSEPWSAWGDRRRCIEAVVDKNLRRDEQIARA